MSGGGLFGEPAARRARRPDRPSADDVDFVHASELLFARLLDFYGIEWEYEPHTFDIVWDESGRPTERFSPDFYLPAYDLHVEVTTMSQKLVTRKNRKIRLLGEHHPDVKCKIFYQRDVHNLATKLGLEIPTEDFTAQE